LLLIVLKECYELTKAVPVVQVLRLKGESAIMLDMLEERALRAIMLAMLDERARRATSIFFVYRKLKHDFLMNRVQLILSLDLLLRLPKLQTLVIK